MANWSLSESPLSLREQIEKGIIDHVDHLLLTYQEAFEDIDNDEYFGNLADRINSEFTLMKTKLPWRSPPDYYLLGKKTN